MVITSKRTGVPTSALPSPAMTSRLPLVFALFQLMTFRVVHLVAIRQLSGDTPHGVGRAGATTQHRGDSVESSTSAYVAGGQGRSHSDNQTSVSPPPVPWELQLAPFLDDVPSQLDANATLRRPARLAGSYKGRWLKNRYGKRLHPRDLLAADQGMMVLHLAEVEGADHEPGPADGGQQPGGGGGGGSDAAASASASSGSSVGGAAGSGGGRSALPGGVKDIQGELMLRDGAHMTDRDLRFRLRGTYVPAAGTLHAVLEPLLPIKEDVDPPPPSRSSLAAGRGGGGVGEPDEDGGSYREALRTAASYLMDFGPGFHRALVRQPPSPPPGSVVRRRAAADLGAAAVQPSPPPRPPLELALVKTCELRARFRAYYKGDPEARAHEQHLHLDQLAPLPQPPTARRRRNRAPVPAPAATMPGGDSSSIGAGGEGGGSTVTTAAAAAAAGGSTARRRLVADTEMYHSTQMQLHGRVAAAAAPVTASASSSTTAAAAATEEDNVSDDELLAGVADAGDGGGDGDDGDGDSVLYGIPAGMDLDDPDLELVGVVLSTNCEFELHFNASSIHLERYYRQAVRYSVMVAVVTIAQIVLSVIQTEASSTPSAAARMSLYSITLQAILDAYQCLLHLSGALLVDALFAAFLTTSLLQFLLFAVFEMRQTLLVWRGQRTNGTGVGDGDNWTVRRDMSAIYTRFYTMLLGGLLLLFQFQSYLPLMVLLLHSWWLPQVLHSAQSDTRPPLKLEYVWGMSALRLLIPLYFYGCPRNLLRIEQQPGVCVALVVWVGLLAAVLTVQIRKGPRAFIPKAFLPQKYDYHRPATKREMGIEEPHPPPPPPGPSSSSSSPSPPSSSSSSQAPAVSTAAAASFPAAVLRRMVAALPSPAAWMRRPGGLAAAARAGGGGSGGGADADVEAGHGSKECVICMNPVPLLPLRGRMVTPCGHFFHEPCLTRWMEVKMDCPTCRRPLPPA